MAERKKRKPSQTEPVPELTVDAQPENTVVDTVAGRTRFLGQSPQEFGKQGGEPFPYGFDGLKCGDWIADDPNGICRFSAGENGRKTVAAPPFRPIIPCRIFENIQNGNQYVELAFGTAAMRMDKRHTVPMSMISTVNKITQLADKGIAVTSDTARALMNFLTTVVNENIDGSLQPRRATSKLGWLYDRNGEQLFESYLEIDPTSGATVEKYKAAFSPYTSVVECDGLAQEGAKKTFTAIAKSRGTFEEWRKRMRPLRNGSMVIRLAFDVMFASVLIRPCGVLPFVFHVWGRSGCGKTVLLMLAASVWGDPELGNGYVCKMQNTVAWLETVAGTLDNLPFLGDELQTIASKLNYNFDNLVYTLTEGEQKGRMTSDMTQRVTNSWNNAFMFTGEQPILHEASKAGARNRVMELEIHDKLFEAAEAHSVAEFVRKHYGTAGRRFVEGVSKLDREEITNEYEELLSTVTDEIDATDKQRSIGALLLLADTLAERFVWDDGDVLTTDGIKPYLKSESETDVAKAAYEAALSIIASNSQNFMRGNNDTPQSYGEIYGKICEPVGGMRSVLFIKSLFEKKLREAGYEFASVRHEWETRGWIETFKTSNGKGETKTYSRNARIHGQGANCVFLKVEAEAEPETDKK